MTYYDLNQPTREQIMALLKRQCILAVQTKVITKIKWSR